MQLDRMECLRGGPRDIFDDTLACIPAQKLPAPRSLVIELLSSLLNRACLFAVTYKGLFNTALPGE